MEAGNKNFICMYCDKEFTRRFTFKRHLQNIHNHEVIDEGVVLKEFSCFSEFKSWKEDEERKTKSSYVKHRGQTTRKTGEIVIYYHCSRSGIYKTRGMGLRNLKSRGSTKIGTTCSSTMKVKLVDGKVFVNYIPKHENHEIQLEHLRLLEPDRIAIAGRLNEDVSEDRILDDDRNSIHAESGQEILDKRDIQNIKRDFNINNSVQRHKNDALSVRLWVQDMAKEGQDNCVIYYKEQGKSDESSLLKDDDFVLIIMTPFQKEMLVKYSRDKICLERTHGLNEYDFILYSVLVIDEFKNGCPVAFCFSNRCTENLFIVFFTSIKKEVGIINCRTFMTDDMPAFYNAWCKVMEDVSDVLLCAWHVTRNWQQNLCKIKNIEKKKIVYKAAMAIRNEMSEEKFNKLLEAFIGDLMNDEDTVEFGTYFQQNYCNRPKKWAYCYRKHLEINTNMYLESLYKKIKYQYLHGRHVKRLDVAIDGLLKLVRDLIFQRLIKYTKKSVPSERINGIKKSHRQSLNINNNMIEVISECEWHVLSVSGETVYKVEEVNKECTVTCCLKCSACKICVHSFTCSCIDNVIRGNICKHIHRVATLCCGQERTAPINILSGNEVPPLAANNQETVLKEALQILLANVNTNSSNSSLKNKIENILGIMDGCKFSVQENASIHKNLNNILKTCNNNLSIQKYDMGHPNQTSGVNIKKKITKQTRFFSTKVKRSRATALKNPTAVESENIKEGLLSNAPVVNVNVDFDHSYNKQNL